MKILIIKRDKIGDMLLVTPMLQHLRQTLPNATIDFLANDYNYFVLKETDTLAYLGIIIGSYFVNNFWNLIKFNGAG